MVVSERGHLDLREQLAALHLEEQEAICGARGQQQTRVLRHVDALAGHADVEDAQTSAVARVVHHHSRVVRTREQQVAVLVEHHLAHGSRVPSYVCRLHYY